MSFIKAEDVEFVLQLTKFADTIPAYAVTVELTPAEVAETKADAEYMIWAFQNSNIYREHSENWTKFKNLIRRGTGGSVTTAPPAPTPPSAPEVTVEPNVQERFSKLVARIKAHRNYTKAMGEDLGIEAASTIFIPEEGKPPFSIRLVAGGKPELVWKKGHYDGVLIQRKDEGGNFVQIGIDMRPNYVDNTATSPVGQSKIYAYRMIYLYKDEQVGEWSDVASISVNGE